MADFIEEEDTQNCRNMIDELLDVTSGLYANEIDFLENIKNEWEGNLTTSQAAWIEKIYKRIFS